MSKQLVQVLPGGLLLQCTACYRIWPLTAAERNTDRCVHGVQDVTRSLMSQYKQLQDAAQQQEAELKSVRGQVSIWPS